MNVILSADDFGRSFERNEAIDMAFRQGLIKSAALLINTPYTQDAVDKAFRGGYINKIHCHFNLTGGDIGGLQKPITNAILNDSYICVGEDFIGYRSKRICVKEGLFRALHFLPILKELDAQYKEFCRITKGKANNAHVDFHLFFNLNFPVSIAFNLITLKYRIRNARIIGEHLKHYLILVLCNI